MIRKILIFTIIFTFLGCQPKHLKNMKIIEIKENWVVSELGENKWMPATVPGCIHTDLLENKKIEDPFYRTNEKKLQWIDKKDWEYKTTFSVDENLLGKKNIRLNFKGLDTYADVYLNNKLILKADNMFREWKVDCKNFLKEGKNELLIIFHSATNVGLIKLKKLGFQPPAENDQSENGEMGENKVSIFTRKAPYQFGWDWGPRFVTCGFWRPVYLEAWDSAKIEYVHYELKKLSKSKAVIAASFEILSSFNQKAAIIINNVTNAKKLTELSVELKKGENNITTNIEIDNPKLWWTNGLGAPSLYRLNSTLQINNNTIDEQNTNYGIRTVKIIQKPDSIGKSFYVELNGIPIFMKGADYIPNDIFPSRVTNKVYEQITQSAVEASINMLRVWGGGIYENDVFYDMCDLKGILVWQDFMFACSMYPVDDEFNENVKQEFADNIKRLRNHPSIALWCGNNEMDVMWAEGNENAGLKWKGKFNAGQRKFLWDGYKKIFYETLPGVLKTLDSSRFYWPSSPIAGYNEYGNPKLTSGDYHYWGVWHGKEPFEKFSENVGRFLSEYGFQSFPEFKTVKSYTIPEDYSIESEVMASHQRSGIGNMLIKKYMDLYYKNPKDFESFLYVSQVQQAEAIKSAIEAHRAGMPKCMGSVYWQLNDCWPVASWSSVDYYNRWKALHYFVKKAFNCYLISPRIENGKVIFYAISDNLATVEGQLIVGLMDFNGSVLKVSSEPVHIRPNTSTKVFESSIENLIGKADIHKILLFTELYFGERKLSENILYFLPAKDLMLPKPNIKASFERNGLNYFITLETDKLARNVYLSIDENDGSFSDNYFDLLPGKNVVVIYMPSKFVNEFEKKLKIKSLVDTY